MTRPGPKPRTDRTTIATTAKAIRWYPADLDLVETHRQPEESFAECVRRLVRTGAEHTPRLEPDV